MTDPRPADPVQPDRNPQRNPSVPETNDPDAIPDPPQPEYVPETDDDGVGTQHPADENRSAIVFDEPKE